MDRDPPSVRAVPPENTPHVRPREAPWTAGLRAARAVMIPGLVLQGVMLALLLAYRFYPPTTALLDRLAAVKAQWGYSYSAVSAIIAGALIPEVLRVAYFQKGAIRRANGANLLFTVPFWCAMGMAVDGFYRAQGCWFGTDAAFPVVAKKVLVDQLVYSTAFSSPVTAMLYDWKNRGYDWSQFGSFFNCAYYRDAVLPTICANWGVWIPVVSILYSLPSLLQIPLFGLALSLWVLIYTWMSERRAGAH